MAFIVLRDRPIRQTSPYASPYVPGALRLASCLRPYFLNRKFPERNLHLWNRPVPGFTRIVEVFQPNRNLVRGQLQFLGRTVEHLASLISAARTQCGPSTAVHPQGGPASARL
jgi:hypothetical protein